MSFTSATANLSACFTMMSLGVVCVVVVVDSVGGAP